MRIPIYGHPLPVPFPSPVPSFEPFEDREPIGWIETGDVEVELYRSENGELVFETQDEDMRWFRADVALRHAMAGRFGLSWEQG